MVDTKVPLLYLISGWKLPIKEEMNCCKIIDMRKSLRQPDNFDVYWTKIIGKLWQFAL